MIREEKKMSETVKALGLSCCAFLLFILCFAVPVSMIVIGAKYKDDCPVEHKIPIWLIVSGVVCLIQGLFSQAFQDDNKTERQPGRTVFQAIGLIANVFQMVWITIGSFWVYSKYEPSYNQTDDADYCEKTVYLFTFWVINMTYIGLLVTLLISGLLLLFNRGLKG